MKLLVLLSLCLSISAFAGIKVERDDYKYELKISSDKETKIIKGFDGDITPKIGNLLHYEEGDSSSVFLSTWIGGNCGSRAYIVLDRKNENLQLNELGDCGYWTTLDANTIFYKGYTKTLGVSFTDGICGTPNSRSSWINVPTKLIRLDLTNIKGYRLINVSEYADHELIRKTFNKHFKFIRKYNDPNKAKTEAEKTFCLSLAQNSDDQILINQLSAIEKK